VTQDLDFSDAPRYVPGTHAGLLLLRLPRPGRTALFDRIASMFTVEAVDSSVGCVVSASGTKVRVRRPTPEHPLAPYTIRIWRRVRNYVRLPERLSASSNRWTQSDPTLSAK
jgi:hypothetical protein